MRRRDLITSDITTYSVIILVSISPSKLPYQEMRSHIDRHEHIGVGTIGIEGKNDLKMFSPTLSHLVWKLLPLVWYRSCQSACPLDAQVHGILSSGEDSL